jgi:serine/threonine protein kinase/Tfp pilus assembly protein PilF
MNLERLNQIEEVYHAVRETPAGEREAALTQLCGADADLLSEVESLLAFESMPENFLGAPPEALAAEMFSQEETRANLTGTEISHYKIINLLGAGGMGEVYLAEDTKLGRKVALKILPTAFAEDADRMSRFVREAKSASALNHPNIITIHEIGESDGTHFIATEFIDGKTLNEYAKSGPLSFKSALEIAIQMASALDEAHSAGIVHRDLKPDNVMVRPNGLVKILDFGIAKLSGSHSRPGLGTEVATAIRSNTTPGMIIGTASHMSPEQAKGREVDARSDIFSFGVCLYEMLTGRLPFTGENEMDVIGAILHKEPAPMDELEVSPDIRRIVEKCLRKDCQERYQTAKDLLIDAKGVWQQLEFQDKPERTTSPNRGGAKTQVLGAPASEVSRTTSSAEYLAGEVIKHKLVWLGALGVLVVTLAAAGYSTAFRPTPIKSIAVLPFVNVGDDRDREYLSDGLSENLINTLSRLSQLKVIARSSSFKYRGENIDIQDAARTLGVGAILTGRVVPRGDELQISVELINTADNTLIWGDLYNRKVSDALRLPEEIAQAVSQKLQLKLSGAQERQIAKRTTQSPQAYQFYMNGIFYRRMNGAGNNRTAIAYQNQAIALDPNFALAYTELSINFAALVEIGALSPKEGMPQARSAAEKALALDETLAEAHDALAGVRYFEFDWAGAEGASKRAIGLNPNLAGAHTLYADYLSRSGRFDEALREIRLAQELDPLRTGLISNEATILYHARRYDEAILLKKHVHAQSLADNPFFHLEFANVYVQKGQYAEAILSYQTSLNLEETTSALVYLGRAYALSGRRKEAAAILDKLNTTERYVSPTELAILCAALGDKEKAFASLEKAFTERDFQLTSLKVEPGYDPLRADPRFQDLMRRVGLPR